MDEADVLRNLEVSEFSPAEFVDLVLGGNVTGLVTNPRYYDFSKFFIRYAEYVRV